MESKVPNCCTKAEQIAESEALGLARNPALGKEMDLGCCMLGVEAGNCMDGILPAQMNQRPLLWVG